MNINEYSMRARWVTSLDVRTQTEYGTLRAYTRAGFQTTTGETTQGRIYTERGFIQFAGFTFGKSQSYFDFFGGAFCYGCGYMGNSSQTGAAGTLLAAYTATFGNGFTATISMEDQSMRRGGVWDASNDATNALVIGSLPGPAAAFDSYNIAAPGITPGRLRGHRHSGHRGFAARRPGLGFGTDRRRPAPASCRLLRQQHDRRGRERAGRELCLPGAERRIRLGRDGGYRHQPAVGEG